MYVGMCYTPKERKVVVRIFRQYRDVFAWTYNDLKKYDTQIIQHIIPIKKRSQAILAEDHKSSFVT